MKLSRRWMRPLNKQEMAVIKTQTISVPFSAGTQSQNAVPCFLPFKYNEIICHQIIITVIK